MLIAAGCCGCLQKASLVPTGQAAMKSIPSSDKQQTGPSCYPPSTPFRSLLGSQAAPTYPQVNLYKSEAAMPFVTASEMPGQRFPSNILHVHRAHTSMTDIVSNLLVCKEPKNTWSSKSIICTVTFTPQLLHFVQLHARRTQGSVSQLPVFHKHALSTVGRHPDMIRLQFHLHSP